MKTQEKLEAAFYCLSGGAVGILIWFALMGLLASCATTRPPADVPQLSLHQDSLASYALVPGLKLTFHSDSLAQLPPYLVPPPAGSTKRQRRQWQRAQARNLAHAGHAPRVLKVKNSTVANGSGSTAVSTAKNSSAAVGEEAKATMVTKAKGPVATGEKSTAVATTKKTFPWWVLGVVAVLVALNRLIRGRWLL